MSDLWKLLLELANDITSRKWLLSLLFVGGLLWISKDGGEVSNAVLVACTVVVTVYVIIAGLIDMGIGRK